ncbi:MAG: PEGA domain-containing protein [Verrucomicrobia bacterium]|jgi:hypothetical protein|nr:PEGA domain-containing protein [Verrucomicrobiota bacterium]MBT7065610.1 PEGA domain-containing protein [Verrucomicrobiota bacterium]MBT7702505.1 PEGA domain-containing protein [Verrucomicrobiota bacterium]
MTNTTRVLGLGLLLVAMGASGCKTTPPTGRGKLCIDVTGRRAGDSVAAVYIDGTKECDISMLKGKGFFLFCPAGKHVIKIEAEGFTAYEKEIKVRRNETTWMSIRLKRPDPAAVKAAEAEAAEASAEKEADPPADMKASE